MGSTTEDAFELKLCALCGEKSWPGDVGLLKIGCSRWMAKGYPRRGPGMVEVKGLTTEDTEYTEGKKRKAGADEWVQRHRMFSNWKLCDLCVSVVKKYVPKSAYQENHRVRYRSS